MKRLLLAVLVAFFGMGMWTALAADAITTGNVNFRSGPGVKYAKRGTIPAGYHLNVGRCSGNWCRVSSARGAGWVSTRYIAFNRGVVHPRTYQRSVYVAPPLFSIHIGRSYHRPRYYRSYHSYRPYRSYYRSHRYHRRHRR